MNPLRRTPTPASLVLSIGFSCVVALADEPGPTIKPADDGRLTLTGTVVLSDGSPAPKATVATTVNRGPSIVATTDSSGQFRLRGMFENGAQLSARSADGKQQTVLMIPESSVRAASAKPLKLTLAPAIDHEITVVAEGRPVQGAKVAASGLLYEVQGTTGADGKVRLSLPAQVPLRELHAWHPVFGVRGLRDLETRPPQNKTELSLIPPEPLQILVVDPDSKPVAGEMLGIEVNAVPSKWAITSKFEAAHARTDAEGTVKVPWAPRENLKYVEVNIIGPEWKIDDTDISRIADRIVTIHARHRVPVEGRLVMPPGANPEGILITGFGFATRENNGDIPAARARADGSFTLNIPTAHAFILGIVDDEWACDLWSGVILSEEMPMIPDISLKAYRATPITVRVTQGPNHKPVANAWVNVGRVGTVEFIDAFKKVQSGQAGPRSWLMTDEKGQVKAGVGRGKTEVRLDSETKTIESADKPIEVEFQRLAEEK